MILLRWLIRWENVRARTAMCLRKERLLRWYKALPVSGAAWMWDFQGFSMLLWKDTFAGSLFCWWRWLCDPQQGGVTRGAALFHLQPIASKCAGFHAHDVDHYWKSDFLSVDSLSHNLPSELHTQHTLAAMSPGMLVTQVRKSGYIVYGTLLYPTRWLDCSVCFLTCPNTCSSPPPCCRPRCPAKCARNVGDSCAPSTTLRKLNFLSFNNGYGVTIITQWI